MAEQLRVERVRVKGTLPTDRHEQPEDPHIDRILDREIAFPTVPGLPAIKDPATLVVPSLVREKPRTPFVPEDRDTGSSSQSSGPLPAPSVPQFVEREKTAVPQIPATRPTNVVRPLAPEVPPVHLSTQPPPSAPSFDTAGHELHIFPDKLHRRMDSSRHNVHWM